MGDIRDIQQSGRKPKEKCVLIARKIREDHSLVKELFELFETGTDPEKGSCADVMKDISSDAPSLLLPYLETLVAHITYKAPHVTWGVQESLGNMAKTYPSEVAVAVPRLLKNTVHESTVVRWCAAYALSEIAKHNAERRQELITTITRLAKKEQNNGVRNVYLKALKSLGQTGK